MVFASVVPSPGPEVGRQSAVRSGWKARQSKPAGYNRSGIVTVLVIDALRIAPGESS